MLLREACLHQRFFSLFSCCGGRWQPWQKMTNTSDGTYHWDFTFIKFCLIKYDIWFVLRTSFFCSLFHDFCQKLFIDFCIPFLVCVFSKDPGSAFFVAVCVNTCLDSSIKSYSFISFFISLLCHINPVPKSSVPWLYSQFINMDTFACNLWSNFRLYRGTDPVAEEGI